MELEEQTEPPEQTGGEEKSMPVLCSDELPYTDLGTLAATRSWRIEPLEDRIATDLARTERMPAFRYHR